MKIGIDMGHTLTGADTGASGVGGREENRTREIGKIVLASLIQMGHTVVDCTVDSCSNLNNSLSSRVYKANSNNVEIYTSIHLNAFNTQARGVEVYVSNNCSNKSIELAQNVLSNLCKLGYVNRGVKKGNLYVLNNTSMPAILVECGFIDNAEDMQLYNATNIAKAIVEGITGQATSINTVANNATTPKSNNNNLIAQLQKECNAQGFSNQVVDGIAGQNTLAGCPLVREGARGNITKVIQQILGVSPDGIFGVNTKAAVVEFQKAHGLDPDGVVGQNTWKKLIYV